MISFSAKRVLEEDFSLKNIDTIKLKTHNHGTTRVNLKYHNIIDISNCYGQIPVINIT